MNMKKSLVALAAVGVMGIGTMVSAAGVGLVNVNAVLAAHPQAGVAEMNVNKIKSEYGTKIQAELAKIEKMKDKAAQEAAYKKNVLPLEQKGNEEIGKVMNPIFDTIVQKIEAVRAQKKLDIVVTDPSAVAVVDKDYQRMDITKEVADMVKAK